MKPTIIGILGKPLAGKDSVASILRRELSGFATVSIGDIIREVKSVGREHRFWSVMHDSIAAADSGGLVKDEPSFAVITTLIEEQLQDGKRMVGWIGGPRSEDQLNWLDQWAKERGYNQEFIYIDTPDEEIRARREIRVNGGRVDDEIDAFSERLRVFERFTKPVIDRLQNEGRLIDIEGVGGKEVVGSRAVESLRMHTLDPEISLPLAARR